MSIVDLQGYNVNNSPRPFCVPLIVELQYSLLHVEGLGYSCPGLPLLIRGIFDNSGYSQAIALCVSIWLMWKHVNTQVPTSKRNLCQSNHSESHHFLLSKLPPLLKMDKRHCAQLLAAPVSVATTNEAHTTISAYDLSKSHPFQTTISRSIQSLQLLWDSLYCYCVQPQFN